MTVALEPTLGISVMVTAHPGASPRGQYVVKIELSRGVPKCEAVI